MLIYSCPLERPQKYHRFNREFDRATSAFQLPQLGIGLASVNSSDSRPFSDADLQSRFDRIQQGNISTLALWAMPVDMMQWWVYLQGFCQVDR